LGTLPEHSSGAIFITPLGRDAQATRGNDLNAAFVAVGAPLDQAIARTCPAYVGEFPACAGNVAAMVGKIPACAGNVRAYVGILPAFA